MTKTTPTRGMLDVLSSTKIAILGTIGNQGPHLAPLWFAFTDGSFEFVTGSGRQKALNVLRDRRVGLAIVHPTGKPAVMIDGTARVDQSNVPSLLESLAIRNLGEQAGKDYVANSNLTNLRRIIVVPVRWKSWGL